MIKSPNKILKLLVVTGILFFIAQPYVGAASAVDSVDAQKMREAVEKARSGEQLSIFVINPETGILATAPFGYKGGHDALAEQVGKKSKAEIVAGVIVSEGNKVTVMVTVPPEQPSQNAKWSKLETLETYLKNLIEVDPGLGTTLQDSAIQVQKKSKPFGSSVGERPGKKVSPLQEGIIKELQDSGEITDREALKNLEEGRPLEGKLQAKVDKIRVEVSEIYQQNPITDPEGKPDWDAVLKQWKQAKVSKGKEPGPKGKVYDALMELNSKKEVTQQDVKELCELVRKETGDENVIEQLKKLKRESTAGEEGKRNWTKEVGSAENEVMSVVREALKSTTKDTVRARAQKHSLGGVVSVANSGKWGIKTKEQLTFDTDFDMSFFSDIITETDPHSGIIAELNTKISELFSAKPEHLGIVITGFGYEANSDVYISKGGGKWALNKSMTQIFFIDPVTGEFSKDFSAHPERLSAVLMEKLLWLAHPEFFTERGKVKPGITPEKIQRILMGDPNIPGAYKVIIEGGKFTKMDAATFAIDGTAHLTETSQATTPEESIAKIAKQVARSSDVFVEGMAGTEWKKHLTPEDIVLMEQCQALDKAKISEAKAHTELIMKLEGIGDPADWTPEQAQALDSSIDKVKAAWKDTTAASESIGGSKTDRQQPELRKRAGELMRRQAEAAHLEFIGEILKLPSAKRESAMAEYQKELQKMQEHYSKKKDVPVEILDWASKAEKSITSLIEIEMIETGKVPKILDSVEKIQKAGKERVDRVNKLLNESETGKKILEKTDKSVEMARKSTVLDRSEFRHPLSDFVGEFIQQHDPRNMRAAVAWAGTLAMAASMIETAMTAKDDVELALGISHSLIQFWPLFMIAENLGLGIMEGDNKKIAKAIMMILLPETALPDMVQAIGNVAVNIAAALSFDAQLDALYYVCEFKEGRLVKIDDYVATLIRKDFPSAEDFKDKSKIIPPIDIEEGIDGGTLPKGALEEFFFYAFVEQGGYKLLQDMIGKAEENSKPTLKNEEKKGINFFMKKEVRDTVRSTVIKGNQLIFKEDGPLNAACANIRKYDQEINDFTSAFNIKIDSTAKPSDFGSDMNKPKAPAWAPDLDQGQVRALSQLIFNREKWRIIAKETFLEALVRTLEIRDRAEKDVNANNRGKLHDDLIVLFKDLDILDVGIASFQDKSGYNIAKRIWNKGFKTQHERDVNEMKVIQVFLDVYSSVKQTREAIENAFRSNTEKEPAPRPLTSSLPLTGDPETDVVLAKEFAQDMSNEAQRIHQVLEGIKNGALDKDGYDQQMYSRIYEAQYLRTFFDIQGKAARRMAKSSWFWQFVKIYDIETAYLESDKKRQEYEKLYNDFIEDFRKHYAEAEKIQKEQSEKEKKERVEQEKAEREKLARERLEKEKREREQQEKAEQERLTQDRQPTQTPETPQAPQSTSVLPTEVAMPQANQPIKEVIKGVFRIEQTFVNPRFGSNYIMIEGYVSSDYVVVTPSPSSGTFPDKPAMHDLQITSYSVTGAQLDAPQDGTTILGYSGRLTGKVLTVSGTTSELYGNCNTEFGSFKSKLDVKVTLGDVTKEYHSPEPCTLPAGTPKYVVKQGPGSFSVTVSLDPNVPSAVSSEGPKPAESKNPKVVLTPSTVAPMKLGEKASIKASVTDAEPGDSPVRYTWSGAGEASGDTVSIAAKDPGKFTVSVSADGPSRNLGSASLEYEVAKIAVNVEKTSPPTNTVTVGGKAQFKATVTSGTGQAGGDINFQWQPHPEIEFEPFEKSATTTATFRRPGTYNIYAQALMKDGPRYATIGESNNVTITVVNPAWKMEFNPQTPLIGQEVRAKISPDTGKTAPGLDMKEMNFRWQLPANARQKWTSQDDREITFHLTDDKSANISCLASTKYKNENLGGAGKTIKAKAYNITIKGPRPRQEFQEWKGDTQLGGGQSAGMKKVGSQFVVDQEILFSSKIKPAPEKPVSYNWTVSPEGCTINSNGGSDTSITCRSTGSYTVMVTAKMDGMEIGSAAANVSVSISQDDISRSNKAKEAYEKIEKAKELVKQGKLDEGIKMADEASKLDPNNTEATALANKWKDEKEKVLSSLINTDTLLKKNKIDEAEKELSEARKLHPGYQPVADAEKLLNNKKKIAAEKPGAESGPKEQASSPRGGQTPAAGEQQIFSNNNTDGVRDNPSAETTFRADRPCLVTYVMTYHYNGGKGMAPGKILLRHEDGTMYGPWQTSGSPDKGNQTNLYWECRPNVVIKPGVYTVIDTDLESWSWNPKSGGGITVIKGVLQPSSQSPAKAPSSGQAGDTRSVKAAAGTPTGTPAMSGTQPVDLSTVGGKKAAPRVVKGVSIDDGSWIRFKSTDENRRSLDIPVPVPTRAAAVAVVSNLDDATYLEQGKTIACITVVKDTGDEVLDIQAGVHSSEWNYGVGVRPKHAWVKGADIGDSRFLVVLPLARPGLIKAIRIDYVETNVPKWSGHAPGFCLRGLSLVADTQGMTLTPAGSSPVSTSASTGAATGQAPASGEQQIFSNNNIDGVWDGPTAATTFRTDRPWIVTYVLTYHYNGGRGQSPGTIALRHEDGTMYGPWQASGRPNQGNQTNLYWECWPNVVINPGVYTVIDSHPASWSWNSRSGGGIAIIKGTPQRSSQLPAKAPSSGQAGDARSVKAAAREDSGSKVGGQVKPVIATTSQTPQSPSTLPTEAAPPPVGRSESGVIDSSSGELEGTWAVPTDAPSLKREIYFSRNGKSYTGKIVIEEGFDVNSFQIGEVAVRVTRVGANVYKGEYLSILDGIRTWMSHTFAVKDDVFYVTDLVGQDDMDPTICRRKKSEAISEAINVRVEKTSPAAGEQQIFSNDNVGGVGNNPTAATTFRTDRPWIVTYVLTYHYNGGRGQSPGTIALRHEDGTMYGLWQASGRPDQGSQTNLYWECWPGVTIKPGVYTVIDSHPASWSWNSPSGGGITIIKGVLQPSSQSPAKAPSSGQAGDTRSVKAAAGTPAMSGTQPVDLSIVGGLPPAISPTAPSDANIVGSWKRTDGPEVYTFDSDGRATGVNPSLRFAGHWTRNEAGKCTVTWAHRPSGQQANFIDYLTVSPDGRSFSGVNNYGNNVNAIKQSGEAPAPSVAVGISGSWSGSYKNTRGESGSETLDIKEEPGGVLKGRWGGVEIVNGRRGGDGVTWEAHVEARDYQVRGTISSDGRRMTLQYSVRDPIRGNYSGVEELARH